MEAVGQLLAPNWEVFSTFEFWIRVVTQVGLFVCSAFFSGSEVALFALSRVDLREMRRTGDPRADAVHTLLDQPRRLIISILCGNEVVNVAAAANMTAIFALLYGLETAAWVTTFVMVPLILLFGEVTPKTVAVSNPVRVSTRIVAPVLSRWVGIAAPLVEAVRFVADRITSWFVGPETRPDNILRTDEFRTMVEEGVLEGELTAVERALIYNLLDAGNTEVVQVLTPRTKASFLSADASASELFARFGSMQKKRIPVFRGDSDHIVGELHVEDIVQRVLSGEAPDAIPVDQLLRPIHRTPSTKTVNEVLDELQQQDAEAALVIGEFGETLGVVTMTDITEFLWGHTYGDPTATSTDAPARRAVPSDMKLKEFNRQTNLALKDARMTTIGGVVMRHLGRELRVGDELLIDGTAIRVEREDDGRYWLDVRPVSASGSN